MSVSRIPANAEANLDEYEHGLLARGARQPSADDPLLFELARKLAPVRSPAHPRAVRSGAAAMGDVAQHDSGFDVRDLHDPDEAAHTPKRRSGGWTRQASALAPAGAALLGAALVVAVFGPKGSAPGLPKASPFIPAGQGAAPASQLGGETVATRSDPDVTPLTVLPSVEFVNSEQRRINLDAGSSPGVPLSSRRPRRRRSRRQGRPVDCPSRRRSRQRRSLPRLPPRRKLPIPTPCVGRRRRRTQPRRCPPPTETKRRAQAIRHRGPLIRRRRPRARRLRSPSR